MSRVRGGTMGAYGIEGPIPGRSKRALKQRLFVTKGKACVKCGRTKQFETLTQVKCTKCKHLKGVDEMANKKNG